MPATGFLKKCELDKIYGRVTISAEAKFLTSQWLCSWQQTSAILYF